MNGIGKHLPLSPDAALVLILADGAMQFSRSADEEMARWLRILRLHGEGGRALQALGVGETPLIENGRDGARSSARRTPLGARAVPAVLGHARTCAAAHGAARVGTVELLVAVIQAYGEPFTEALHANGTSAGEVLEQIATHRAAA
jgi:hypothetical protein